MIEVLFGESEAGSMKAAKRKHLLNKQLTWIPGNSKEVICLAFMLDIGDIKESVDSDYRKNLIFSILYQEWNKNQELESELKEAGTIYSKELQRLKNYLADGESIRIWYSNSPYSLCGLYFLCDFLRDYKNAVWVVKLPEYKINENCTVSYQNWGEVAPEEFGEFLQYERQLSLEERQMFASRWTELIEENMPLRAVVNGKLLGVPEEFYDFLIWQKLTKKPIKQARLIGDILGYYPISIGDWWYAQRIEKFIEAGRINIIEDSRNKYARKICLA